jgi:threonyl-tRNA synthetase
MHTHTQIGAYWLGNASNVALQRVYGISFAEKKKLKEHLEWVEEAKRRDHRVIGREQVVLGLKLLVYEALIC